MDALYYSNFCKHSKELLTFISISDIKKYMEQSHPFPISFNNLNSTAHIYFNDDISVNDDNDSVS